METKLIALILTSTWLAVAQVAAPPAAADLGPEVSRLVRQLNSDELTRRDLAEKELIALGPAALAHLPATNDRTPAEVAQRLTRVRQAFEQARAEQAAQGSTVSLTGDLPLAQVLKDFSKQSGNALIDHREREEDAADPALHVDFEKTLFWRALDQTLDQAHLDVDSFSGEPGVTIVGRTPGRAARTSRASYSGPFRLEPARFEAVRDLRNPDNRSLKLFIDVAWEPRLKPIVISQPLDQISAMAGDDEVQVDGQGEPTAPIADSSASVELVIPLVSPSRKQGKITSLKGQLKALVPGEVETFRFSELPTTKEGAAKKIEQRKAAVTVTLDGLRKNNDIWELRVRARFDDPANALDSYLSGWLLNNEVYMEKKGQEPVEPGGFEQYLQTPNEVGVKYLFDLPDGPKGFAFVYKAPTAVFNVPVDYEFKDLELP
jgi:hypothetical protein